MSAPSYTQIFDIEGQVEAAVAAVLGASPYSIPNPYTPRSDQINLYPNVMAVCQVGEEQGHRGLIGDGSNLATPDAWYALLGMKLETKRPDTTIGQHAIYRAAIRKAFQYFTAAFDATKLPYHVLTMIKHQGCAQSFADDIDISELTYQLVVSVRPGAWPTA